MPLNIKTNTNININGKTYRSLADIPKEFQHLVEDKDQNGRPDFADRIVAQVTQATKTTPAQTNQPETNPPQPDLQPSTHPNHTSLSPQESQLKTVILIIGFVTIIILLLANLLKG